MFCFNNDAEKFSKQTKIVEIRINGNDGKLYMFRNDFIEEGSNLEAVKSFMYLKVKLLFDPPLSSSLIESTNKLIAELEWRLNVEAETPAS